MVTRPILLKTNMVEMPRWLKNQYVCKKERWLKNEDGWKRKQMITGIVCFKNTEYLVFQTLTRVCVCVCFN